MCDSRVNDSGKARRVAVFCALCLLYAAVSPPAQGVVLDLTTVGSSGTINGADLQQYTDTGAGSGNIDSFVRIQSFGVQQGYNTDYRGAGFPEFDENTSANFTHSILLSSVPLVISDGIGYREFLLDINQNGQVILSLDELRFALHDLPDMIGYSSIFASPVYDLDDGEDSYVVLDYSLNGGSGQGDMLAYIPDSLFMDEFEVYLGEYVYLYSKFGENSPADDGYEEWAHGINGSVVPEPTTLLLLGLGGLAMLRRKRNR
jgi:hypothetical protein